MTTSKNKPKKIKPAKSKKEIPTTCACCNGEFKDKKRFVYFDATNNRKSFICSKCQRIATYIRSRLLQVFNVMQYLKHKY